MTNGSGRLPIFVHASARSGSTYFFNVLRRIESLLCFNEAINDEFSYGDKNDYSRGRTDFSRRVTRGEFHRVHYFLREDGKAEFIDAWDNIMHLYPPAPSFREYVPPRGVLPAELRNFLSAVIDYAIAKGKRPVLCEVFSRGRAGALKDAFGGFHITQFRDPLSQFGSCFRTLEEIGGITFMIIPLLELGASGESPLYLTIPEAWRVPVLPWPRDDYAQRWASTQQYLSMIISAEPGALDRVLRWHLLSWFLNNIAAIIFSEFVLDIDRAFDDLDYRAVVRDVFRSQLGVAPDLSDITKFTRYYHFEGVDTRRICTEVMDFVSAVQKNGVLSAALAQSTQGNATIPLRDAIDLLCAKLETSLAASLSAESPHYVSLAEWKKIVQRNRPVGADPQLRALIQSVFPYVFPVVRTFRKIRNML